MQPATKSETKEWVIWAILIGLALVWGSSFILMDKASEAFSAMDIAALRMCLSAIALLPFSLHTIKQIPKSIWKYIVIVGWVGSGIPAFIFPFALRGVNSATEGILNSLTPVFVLIFGVFFGIKITKEKFWGILLGLSGAMIVTLSGGNTLEGSAFYGMLIVGATMLYGISVNVVKKYLNDTDPLAISAFGLGATALPYLIYILCSDIPHTLVTHPHGWSSMGYMLILALLNTTLSTLVFYKLVQMTDAVRSSSVTYMMPIVAVMWGMLRPNREDISLLQIGGMLVILVGVYLVNRKANTRPSSAQ